MLSQGQADAAASLLREALGLWRGGAFEEFLDTDVGAAESDRLAELRLAALEDRVEADLRLGRHRELVAELEGLVREQPLRERLWAQLLLALYRSGRQADALLAYQRARSVLVEELGIDPGAELRRLHAAILAQDPGWTCRRRPRPAAESCRRRCSRSGPPFVGRAAELAWLQAAWTSRQRPGRDGLAGRRARAWARPGWPPSSPERSTTRAAGCCTAAARQSRTTRCSRSRRRSPGWAHPRGGARRWAVPGGGRSGLAELLAGRPDTAVLLVLDDLHLAQAPALEALAGLVAAAATRRLLVLGAYRDEAASPGLAAGRAAGSERRGAPAAGPVEPGRGGPGPGPLRGRAGGAGGRRRGAGGHRRRAAAGPSGGRRLGAGPGGPPGGGGGRPDGQQPQPPPAGPGQARRRRGRPAGAARAHPAGRAPGGRPGPTRPRSRRTGRPRRSAPTRAWPASRPSDAEFFFGRERLVAELVTHLVGAGLVGVVGPSGSGKSSLVRAGLLPALADGVLPGSDRWRQLLVRPGEHPMAELGLRSAPAPGRRHGQR